MTMVLLYALACGADGVIDEPNQIGEDSGFVDSVDDVPPMIEFVPLEDNQLSGADVVLEATITDDGTGVFLASLFYRNETDSSKDWSSIGFVPQGEPGAYAATIQADEQHSSGMWYYLLALDGSQNETLSPTQGADQPYHFGYTD